MSRFAQLPRPREQYDGDWETPGMPGLLLATQLDVTSGGVRNLFPERERFPAPPRPVASGFTRGFRTRKPARPDRQFRASSTRVFPLKSDVVEEPTFWLTRAAVGQGGWCRNSFRRTRAAWLKGEVK